MSEQEAVGLSDDDAIALVFRPGFSTAPATTDVSGRGVGMDAVRTSVRQVGGEVRIQSTPRRGTAIIVDLPAPAGHARRRARSTFGLAPICTTSYTTT